MNAPVRLTMLDRAAAAIDDYSAADDSKRERLRPKSLLEVMAKPVPSWLVRDLVPDRGLGVIFGPPNSGKSFCVLDLSMSVARGVECFGRRTKQRGVVYIAAEGNLSGRLAAYLKHHGVRAEDLVDSIRIVDGALNMRDPMADLPEFLEEIARARDEMGGIGLVVIDTLNRVMAGGKENSDEDMGAVIAACRRLEDVTGGLVLLIHHSGKNADLGARGHSSLLAAADVEFKVEGTEGPRTLSVTKMRDGSTDQSFAFSLDVVDLGPRCAVDPDADDDERVTSCVVVPCDSSLIAPKKRSGPTGKNKKVVFAELRQLAAEQGHLLPETSAIPPGNRGVRVDAVIARVRHALVSVDEKRKTERIMEALNSLRDDGFVGIADPWVWPC